MLGEFVQLLQRIFTGWALGTFILCGAWLFLVVNPTMAQRGLVKETKLARWGGLIYLTGGIGLFLLMKLIDIFSNF